MSGVCHFGQTLLPHATKLGQGYVFTSVCDSVHRGRVVSQHALQQGGGIPACIACGIPACLAAVGVSRPTPRGEVEGSGLGGSPGPHPREKLRGGGVSRPTPGRGEVSRPTPGGCVSQHALRQTPPDIYCCGQYASYWKCIVVIL